MKKNYSSLLHFWLWYSSLLRFLLFLSLTALSLATLAGHSAAQAEEAPANLTASTAESQATAQPDDRLALPQNAIAAPVGSSNTAWSDLSPPPTDQADQAANPTVPDLAPATPPIALNLLQTVEAASAQKPVELKFDLSSSEAIAVAAQPNPNPPIVSQVSNPSANPSADSDANLANLPLDRLFAGDSDSLVAKAVGSAEGTRTPDGDRNPAYYGHVDPGNKAWNLGSFSYQHGAASPEEADRKQLQRLQDQAAVLQETAIANGMDLTLEETLNGIDLANQAPKAALDRQGYIDWLAKAHAIGKSGEDAILWARAQSYFDPAIQRWNAPGLGNTEERITQDQARRMAAISQAIGLYQPQKPPVQPPAVPIAKAGLNPLPNTLPDLNILSKEIGISRLFQQKPFSQFSAPAETKQSMRSSVRSNESLHNAEMASADLLFSLNLPAS